MEPDGSTAKSTGCQDLLQSYRFPIGGWIILVHETLERFAFYGMKAIITIYLNLYLGFSEQMTTILYHTFSGFSYFTPILGAIISDNYLGKFKTIVVFGFVYLIGHILMPLTAIKKNIAGPLVGVFILAIGSGSIKSSVAAFGGDQIPSNNEKMVEKYFSLFYTSINIGAFVATFVTPILRKDVSCVDSQCYPLAFGVPAATFLITYIIFLAGKRTYNFVPASKNVIGKFLGCIYRAIVNYFNKKSEKRPYFLDYACTHYSEEFIEDAKKAWKIMIIFSPLTILWALYDQQGSRWTLQAKYMDGKIGDSYIIKPEQIQLFNPLFIIIFIPIFEFIVYPLFSKIRFLTKPTSRIVCGYMVAAVAFAVTGVIQITIDNGKKPDFGYTESKVNLINAIDSCTLNGRLANYTVNIKPNQYEVYNTKPGNNSINITCSNNLNINYKFNINKNEMKSIFIYTDANQSNGFKIITGKVKFTKAYESLIRYKQSKSNNEIETIYLKRNGDKLITINDDYKELKKGVYSVLCGKTKRICGSVNILSGSTYTIYQYADTFGVFKEFIPKHIHILWQLPQYLIMTCAEILCSVTALSWAYSAAPKSMTSLMQAAYLLTIFGGNMIVVTVASGGEGMDRTMEFFLFTALAIGAGIINWVLIWCVSDPKKIKVDNSRELY